MILSDRLEGTSLTPRETEVLRLAAMGLSIKEVAAHLGLSYHTVKNQLERAYIRLGVRTLVQAMHALGWVRLP